MGVNEQQNLDLITPAGLAAARDVAIAAARAGADVALRYFGHNPAVRRKSDMTPVTEADVAAEEAIVAVLRAAYPDYALWAEESAPGAAIQNDPTWIVDPIDGTKQFMRGIPFFATLIALAVDGQPVVGVSYAPALNEMLTAVRGGGATYNGQPTTVSGLSDDRQNHLSCTGHWRHPVSIPITRRCVNWDGLHLAIGAMVTSTDIIWSHGD